MRSALCCTAMCAETVDFDALAGGWLLVLAKLVAGSICLVDVNVA